jgi:hypothetical protein
MTDYILDIKNHIKKTLSSDRNVFESLNDLFKSYFEKPAHNIQEIKARTTKMKGDIFETFCKLYLEANGYEVWFVKDLEENKMKEFSLTKKDYGIDLIALKNSAYYAVQCKYRKPSLNSLRQTVHRITWKDISTFLALSSRTGPKEGWKKHIIMTNADYVSWKGKKGEKDFTIAKKTFENLKREFWCKFIDYRNGQKLDEEEKKEEKKDIKELRKKWLDNLLFK